MNWIWNAMIPTIIQREHVFLAADWIDQHGVGERNSRRYLVVINGKSYPPKLVISRAYFYAHGSEWSHENFTGGRETNSYLRGLGFEIIERGSIRARASAVGGTSKGTDERREPPSGPPPNMYA